MSNKRITDLTELTTPTTDDVFPVVDIATNTTTKVQLANLPVQTAVTTALATKQATLVSGTNIKTVNSTSLLGSGDIPIPIVTPSGVAGAIQFSNGSAFSSDATNLFWDDTNNRLGVGTNTPTGIVQIKTTQANTNGSIVFINNNASTIASITDTGSALTTLQFRGSNFGFVDGSGVLIGGGYGDTPTARLHIKGSGSTSATTSLLVQNSSGSNVLRVYDNGGVDIGLTNSVVTLVQGYNNAFAENRLSFYSASTNIRGINAGGQGIIVSKSSGVSDLYPSSIFAIDSTTQGFLPPRMTTTQRDAIVTPATGLKIYNTTLGTTDTYDGATWQRFGQQTLIKGSGSTSATTSLLVQNSAGTELIKVADNGDLTTTDIIARSIYAKASTLDLRGNSSGSASSASLQGFVSGSGWLSMFTAESGKDFGQIPRGAVVNGTTIDASAIFQVNSTTKGLLMPRMTTTQKNAIASPAAGLTVYDSTTNKLNYNNGTTWKEITPDGYTGLVTINATPPVTFDIQNGIIVNVT